MYIYAYIYIYMCMTSESGRSSPGRIQATYLAARERRTSFVVGLQTKMHYNIIEYDIMHNII